MRPHLRVLSLPTAYRLFGCLCVALCAMSTSTASAQPPVSPEGIDVHAYPAVGKAYSCVDPSDVMTRRWFQDEPCKLPMVHLPAPGAAESGEPPRRQTLPPRSPATDGGHAMFWRFPVQGGGPHSAPRHSWR
jgi:hypothetical protein